MEHYGKIQMSIDTGRREVAFSRVFDAPREFVFKVYTDPKMVPQWWGPRHLLTTVDQLDLRPGGVWRYIQRAAGGAEYAFTGVYREVLAPERLVYTFEYEGEPRRAILETVTFTEQAGRTNLTITDLFQTVEDLYDMLKSGMDEGIAETFDRLAELLHAIQQSTR